MKQINFLRLQQEKIRQKAKRVFYIQILGLSALVIYALVVIGAFAYYFVLTREEKLMQQKIDSQREIIKSEIATETKQVYLRNKAAALGNILESARNHQIIIEGIFNLLTPGIEISGFEVSSTESISFSGRAMDFDSLAKFFDNIKKGSLGENLPIYSASVGRVAFDKKGGYSFSVNMSLVKDKNAQKK